MCSSSDSMADSPRDERKSNRRSNKPLMEKRRRARINECLTELKGLVLQAMKKDSTQYSKLEKADILEMTVKHLKLLQRQHVAATLSNDPFIMNKYRAGFNECAGEVARYMDSSTGVDRSVKNRVLNHLANCVNHVTPNTQSAQVHPALIQPLHVQMPSTNQLGVSAFSITCAPTWNVIGSNNITNITMSGNAQQNIRPSPSPAFSTKMEYSTANRIPDTEARPPRLQCIVSPLDTTCDVKADSSGTDDVEICSSLDLSVKNHCDRQSPKDISEPVVDVPVKQEHRPECIPEVRVPTPQVQGPAHASNDTMWRPW